MVLERQLKPKLFDACVDHQQMLSCAGLREVVIVLAIDRAPAPVPGGISDEPFHPNIIAVEANTAVRSKIRELYLNLRGSDLLQDISCNRSAET